MLAAVSRLGAAGAAAGPTLPPDVLRGLGAGDDWLVSWWLPALVGAFAACLVAGGVLLLRSRRRVAGVAASACGGVVVALALALGANSFVGYVPNLADARTVLSSWGLAPAAPLHHGTAQARAAGPGRGAVHEVEIAAPARLRMPHDHPAWVYTPPGYDPAAGVRYPVTYLIHGSPGHAGDWFAAGQVPRTLDTLIAARLVPPMIVVSADVNGTGRSARDTECLDSTRGGAQVETYLDHVVVPYVDAHYATRPDWRDRAIGGMSSGAFCALDQALRHQDLFGAVVAIGPFGDPGSGGRAMLSTEAQFRAHAPSSYLPTMRFTHPVRVFLDYGGAAHGPDTRDAHRLAAQLRARRQPVTLHDEPGQQHTWRLARIGLPYGLVDVWGSGSTSSAGTGATR